MLANIALPLLAVLTGWLALLPVRKELGPWYYHLCSMPVGALAWPIVFGLTTLFGTPLSWAIAVTGHVIFVAAVYAVGRLCTSPTEARFPNWSYVAAGSLAAAVAIGLGRLGATAIAFDSFTHYELSGIWLSDTGQLDALILGARGPLVPSLHAATHLLGGRWTYAIYTVFSLVTLAALSLGAYSFAFRRLRSPWSFIATFVPAIVLGLLPQWIFHSFFVHSNMISAAYMMLAVMGVLGGAGLLGIPGRPSGFWLVAGLSSAGLAMARPDGLAYAVVILLTAAVIHAAGLGSRRKLAELYAGLGIPLLLVYVPVLVTQGVWRSYKLQGSWMVALMALVAALGVVTLLVPRIPLLGRWLLEWPNGLRLAIVLNVVGILLVSFVRREDFFAAASNMLGNLMLRGAWGFFWYATLGVIIISLLFRSASGFGKGDAVLLYSVAQFFAVALVVHGVTHPGRLSWMDSFNRVALHIAPVAWLYAAAFVAKCVAAYSGNGSAEA